MAQIVSNEKGFKVIHVETLDMWAIGSPAKCDYWRPPTVAITSPY